MKGNDLATWIRPSRKARSWTQGQVASMLGISQGHVLPDKRLRDLILHFSQHRLRNEDFEYPDLLGAAYEYSIREFADSAGASALPRC